MNAIATKLQVGTAALAVAAAATLTPVAAQAAPAIPVPTAPVTQVLDHLSLGPATIPDINWFYFGPTDASNPPVNRNGDPALPFFAVSFKIPLLSPFILQPLFQALFKTDSFTACVAGLSVKLGPYGTITKSIANGCPTPKG
jgi:hypothetical protein